jgi:hypothetical protein
MRKLAVLIVVLLMVFMTVGVSSAAAPVQDPTCTNSFVRQVQENDFAYITHVFSSVRYTPGGAVKEVFFAPIELAVLDDVTTITDNPGVHQFPCVADTRWVYVQYEVDGVITKGWSLESQILGLFGPAYWIAPGHIPDPVTPTSCSNAPTFALVPGGQGQIAQVFSTLRDFPGGPGTRINSPAIFNVVDPTDPAVDPAVFGGYTQPTCAGGLAFYLIDYGGDIGMGWASEGQGSSYYLTPYTPPPAPAAG